MIYCLLLLAGCTTSYALLDSIRPVFQTGGEATLAQETSSYKKGKQLFTEGKYGLALEAFRQANAQNPNSVNVLNGIAACYDQLQRYDLANSYYFKALKVQPNSVKTLNNLAYSYMLQNRYADAQKILQLALSYKPDNARSTHNLGIVYSRLAESPSPEINNIALTVPVTAAPVTAAPVAAAPVTAAPATVITSTFKTPVDAADLQAIEEQVKVVVLSVGNRIEVSNGNGRTGMAKALSNYLKSHSERVWKISNSRPFTQEKTTLYYLTGKQIEAEQLAIKVPASIMLKEAVSNTSDSDLRLVIGHDFTFSSEEEIHMMAKVLNKVSSPSAQYNVVLMPARLEVANGNGKEGMARLMTSVLARHGQTVVRVTNADNFDYSSSTIYYMPERRQEAEKIASSLPVQVDLKEMDITHRRVDIRIVIGKDLLEAEGYLNLLSSLEHV